MVSASHKRARVRALPGGRYCTLARTFEVIMNLENNSSTIAAMAYKLRAPQSIAAVAKAKIAGTDAPIITPGVRYGLVSFH